jgi:uncharacterized Ntn-hydrolase superfamily protein
VTFSLLGRCARTGRLGVVVSSSSPAVAARCAYVRAGVGAATSQNVTDPRLGPALLDALEQEAPVEEAVDRVVAGTPHAGFRQLAALDARGRGAAFTGERALGRAGHRVATDCVAAGNLLADETVLDAMVAGFAGEDDLGDRLVAALRAGLGAGGEEGPVRSAGLLIADEVSWPVADLRVDWDAAPVERLAGLWDVWKPQLGDYVLRAVDPARAPGFGVPGSE